MVTTPGGRKGDASPLGKPGGPGLDGIPDAKLPDYVRIVANMFIRDHGYSRSHAIAAARDELKEWSVSPHTRPQVKAAAIKALAELAAEEKAAKLFHAKVTSGRQR